MPIHQALPQSASVRGNVSVIVDETADLADAASKITASKTFDNSTSCSSENAIIVVDAVYDRFVDELNQVGGRLLNGSNGVKLRDALFGSGSLNRAMLAQDIDVVMGVAGITTDDPRGTKFLLLEGEGIGSDFPESGEKLSLVTTLYKAKDFETGNRDGQ